MNTKIVLAGFLTLVLLGSRLTAEDEAPKPPRKPGAPVRLQVVYSRYQGEKKIGSVPYTLSGSANGEPTRLRMGIQVPLRFEGKDIPGNVIYKSVGNNLDCSTDAMDDGRFKVACTIEQSSLYASEGGRTAAGEAGGTPPVLRNLSSEATVILRDGQTAQYTAATDPVSGETVKIDVRLDLVK